VLTKGMALKKRPPQGSLLMMCRQLAASLADEFFLAPATRA